MCGLIGYSGKDNYDISIIKFIMMTNIVRGEDATGMFVNNEIVKSLDKVHEFLAKEEDKIVPGNLFLAHTRKRSVGVNKLGNTHPFKRGKIVGAHNGTLTDYEDEVERIGFVKTFFDTDSEALYQFVDYYDEDLSKFMPRLRGAAAMLWINTETNVLNAYRNKERPLYYWKKDDNVYFSSMEESFYASGATIDEIHEISEDTHYQFQNGEIIKQSPSIKLTPKFPTVYGAGTANYNSYSETEDFLDHTYVQANTTRIDKDITRGKLYYLVDIKSKYGTMCEILNDKGDIVSVYKDLFDLIDVPKVHSYAKIIENEDSKFFEPGELIYIIGTFMKSGYKYYTVEKIPFNNKVYDVPSRMIRPILKSEKELMKDQKESETVQESEKTVSNIKFKKANLKSSIIYDDLSVLETNLEIAINKARFSSDNLINKFLEPIMDVLEDITELKDSLINGDK